MELRDQMEVKDIFLEVVEEELIHQVQQEVEDLVEEEQHTHHHRLILEEEAVEETLLECVVLQVLEDLV